MSLRNRVCLVSIDGWGLGVDGPGNAIALAHTPVMSGFATRSNQYTALDAHGLAVGLPAGLMGNSEVGHLTMGAGRVQYQDLVRINLSITNNEFKANPVLIDALEQAKVKGGRVHFLGLVSDGGVHSHIDHLYQFLDAAKQAGVPQSFVHFFGDGRDTSPTSGVTYLASLLDSLEKNQYGSLATIMGRFYAMDRDKRWDRVKVAYEALLAGKSAVHVNKASVVQYVQSLYAQQPPLTDEFLTPIVVDEDGLIRANDTLIFFNFRADRMREIVDVLGMKTRRFESAVELPPLFVFQMTQYNEAYTLPILYPPQTFVNVLSEWLSKMNLLQFHTAETEKYAHVTFFFNGGREDGFENETRKLVPSPHVATYDLAPAMNMEGVRDEIVKAMEENKYDFIVCNLAAPDMVGHTGKLKQTIEAVQVTDHVIGNIYDACVKNDYILVVSSDHGNAEEMIADDGTAKTSHTSNPVPFVIANTNHVLKLKNGGLQDVAPTILTLMGLPIPDEMTGKSLI